MNREIPIFFSIDDAYAPYLAVALNSAVQNCRSDRIYKIIVLHKELSDVNKQKISAFATDNFIIEFVPMGSELEAITDRMSNRLRFDYFTLTIYFRLFIPVMFPQYDKAIYIDSDTVITGDLAELYDIDIGENYIGACHDLSVLDHPILYEYMDKAVGVPSEEYVNSGVLLMNLKLLREKELDRHFMSLLNEYHFDSVAPDQDYLNALCRGKIYYLPEVWNAMPNDKHPPLSDLKLIHYNLFSKPWCYDGLQYGEYFWNYATESGYLEEVREYKDNYSQEKIDHDKKSFEQLVSRAINITNSDVTFKKIGDSGVKIKL